MKHEVVAVTVHLIYEYIVVCQPYCESVYINVYYTLPTCKSSCECVYGYECCQHHASLRVHIIHILLDTWQ